MRFVSEFQETGPHDFSQNAGFYRYGEGGNSGKASEGKEGRPPNPRSKVPGV
jgi:hypothetical protein